MCVCVCVCVTRDVLHALVKLATSYKFHTSPVRLPSAFCACDCVTRVCVCVCSPRPARN